MRMLGGCLWSRQLWALAACALIGFAIGPITTGLSVPSSITTLGMLYAVPDCRADLDHLGAQFTEDHPGIGRRDAAADLDERGWQAGGWKTSLCFSGSLRSFLA